jgi:hypothetical protein
MLLIQLILKKIKKCSFINRSSSPFKYNGDELQHPFLICRERERDDAAGNITYTDRENSFHDSLDAVNKIAAFCLQLAQSV